MTPFHLYYPNYYKYEEVVYICLSACLSVVQTRKNYLADFIPGSDRPFSNSISIFVSRCHY